MHRLKPGVKINGT